MWPKVQIPSAFKPVKLMVTNHIVTNNLNDIIINIGSLPRNTEINEKSKCNERRASTKNAVKFYAKPNYIM